MTDIAESPAFASVDERRPSGSRYLRGNFAPVLAEETVTDLEVIGDIPADLDGRLLRNGPDPLDDPEAAGYHWFTGNGTVHGVRVQDGRALWYRNRHVRGEGTAELLGETPPPGPVNPMFRSGANTNVVQLNGETWAIVEAGGLPSRLSHDLDTLATDPFGGTLAGPFTAHPKVDPATGDAHAICYGPTIGNSAHHVVIGSDNRVKKTVEIPLDDMPMIHDCAITESSVLVLDLPCVLNLEAAMAGEPLPFRWTDERPARIGVLAKDADTADDIRWIEIDPCYIFHPMNAYDLPGGGIVLDAARLPKVFATDFRSPYEGPQSLRRWTLDPATGTAHEETLDDFSQDFPRINESLIGRPNRYGYSIGVDPARGLAHGPVVKHDLQAGTATIREMGDHRTSGEAIFVPRDGATAEDDGYVMSYVYDASTDTSDVVILDAQDFAGSPLATIKLPVRVPFGFHCNWASAT